MYKIPCTTLLHQASLSKCYPHTRATLRQYSRNFSVRYPSCHWGEYDYAVRVASLICAAFSPHVLRWLVVLPSSLHCPGGNLGVLPSMPHPSKTLVSWSARFQSSPASTQACSNMGPFWRLPNQILPKSPRRGMNASQLCRRVTWGAARPRLTQVRPKSCQLESISLAPGLSGQACSAGCVCDVVQ